MKEIRIKNFLGDTVGIIREASNGDKTAYVFPSMQIVGYYKKSYDYTTDFIGRIVSHGDTVVNLIYENR